MPFQTAEGEIIYEPCSRDNDTTKDLFQDLKDHQAFEGSVLYSAMLMTYQMNRIQWELEGSN